MPELFYHYPLPFPSEIEIILYSISYNRGLDPLVFCGICGVVSSGIGFAAGTQLFKLFWKLFNKDKATMLLEVRTCLGQCQPNFCSCINVPCRLILLKKHIFLDLLWQYQTIFLHFQRKISKVEDFFLNRWMFYQLNAKKHNALYEFKVFRSLR